MTFKNLKKYLSSIAEFKDIDSWCFKNFEGGIVARHKYQISYREQKYFVKDIKENEKNILKILNIIGADFIPRIIYPELLDKNILVSEYIEGTRLSSKKLDPELVIKYARFQNLLNNKGYLESNHLINLANYSDSDGGFFKSTIKTNFNYGYRCLRSLRKFNLEIVELNLNIMEKLREERKDIIHDFSTMPFARQHHDFKEDNIIGCPQKLTDWGSSYGYGPFLFDIAPFLLNDRNNYELFIKNSDICQLYDHQTIDRWLFVSAVARFVENLRYRLRDNDLLEDQGACKSYLQYEYQTYLTLLK